MKGLNDADLYDLILSVKRGSGGTRKLEPITVGEKFQLALDAGESLQTISQAFHIGPDMVQRFVSIGRLSPETKTLISWGSSQNSLSFSAAFEISRLPTNEEQDELARSALEYGFSKAELSQAIQRYRRSKKGLPDAIASILALRPEIERRHVIIGAILNEELAKRIDIMSPSERNNILENALQRLVPGADVSARLTSARFVLSASDADAGRIQRLSPTFEIAINKEISEIASA